MQAEELKEIVINTLDDMKAQDVVILDVRGKTSITDFMIIASGTSDRHVKSIAQTVAFQAKQRGEPALGSEGVTDGEWALIDLNGVIVHVMQPKVRDYYQLERLWKLDPEEAEKLHKQQQPG
ncbi:MAG: ribosome silencing factor [Gammaproteobacteria bacterium]|nr:ribosome silencing factor [Gammaproteobacteria bacterium]